MIVIALVGALNFYADEATGTWAFVQDSILAAGVEGEGDGGGEGGGE